MFGRVGKQVQEFSKGFLSIALVLVGQCGGQQGLGNVTVILIVGGKVNQTLMLGIRFKGLLNLPDALRTTEFVNVNEIAVIRPGQPAKSVPDQFIRSIGKGLLTLCGSGKENQRQYIQTGSPPGSCHFSARAHCLKAKESWARFQPNSACGSGCWMLDAGCWMLDAGCWMLDAGCWMLDAGCWMLDAGCWMLDAGCWMLDMTVVNTYNDGFETGNEPQITQMSADSQILCASVPLCLCALATANS